ncbi:GGDEF domain-containing protein [Qipengyuania gaetbuli]|uniref:GGDEF domain-containing protein n=1 Tax=Qipengyuania gaetbuli TaxID=266952 RepID=UPI001CFC6593|nr:GGDEF domain-containing protein [Qipengyuania gaetbuli]
MREQIIGLITPLSAVIFCVLFLVIWKRGKMDNYVLAFAATYFFFTVGFTVTHLLDTASSYVFHLTQFFYSLSVASAIWGLTRRVGQPPYLGALLLVYGLSAVTLAVAVAVSADISSRLIIVNTGYGVMYVIGLMSLLNAHRREVIDRFVIFMHVLLAAQFLIRPVITLMFEGSIIASEYRESIYYSVVNLSLSIISLSSALVLLGACIYDQMVAVREKAELDMLTGLRTRRAFEQDVIAWLEKAKQEAVPVSLVVADIDHFKAVNDVYGHQTGDNAIAEFGEVIRSTIRDTDIAGRIGGEEFCVLAWNCDGAAAMAMAERVRRRFGDRAIEGMPEDHRLTASFGVAGRDEGEGYGRLFARCDAALYAAKQGGRNRIVHDGKMDKNNVVTEWRGEDELRAARA